MAERKKVAAYVLAWMYDVGQGTPLAKGRHVLIENPWNSAMWDCKQSQRFFHKDSSRT